MIRNPWKAIAAISLVLGLGSAAPAADMCFDSGGLIFAAKKFRVPGPGRCVQIGGQQQNTATLMNGVACTRSDGTALRVQMSVSQMNPPGIEFDHYDLALPAMTGTVRVMNYAYDTGVRFQNTFSASLAVCSPSTVAIQ